jgi:peptidoglycan/LPS O-acetylase OafA/YrhL
MKGQTVKQLLDTNGGVAPGFDALRFILSVTILLWHTVYVCYGRFSQTYDLVWSYPLVLPFLRGMLPMFFFLGGFLVTGSAYRTRKLGRFLWYRVLRIVPALLVEVTLSAVILGAFLTELPLTRYYSDPGFFSYFLNIVGLIHFTLPGVFQHSVLPTNDVVNVNLWTLPPDFEGYFLMAVLLFEGIIFKRSNFKYAFIIGNVIFLALLPTALDWGDSGTVYIQPKLLIYSFFLGTACYIFSDKIPIRRSLMLLAIAGLGFFCWKYTIILGVWSICYLTICLGFLNLKSFPLIRRGDYSYGIYLYGFPIERALFHFLPFLKSWWELFIVALPLTLIFAVLSWHYIEKPCLRLKSAFSKPIREKLASEEAL